MQCLFLAGRDNAPFPVVLVEILSVISIVAIQDGNPNYHAKG